MSPMNPQITDVYEGDAPYLFLSYSHKDQQAMATVRKILSEHGIRYWYDNGLHSGDDWNMVIARRLKGAAVCLLLLSPHSAQSEYVKNELNFAQNHRIPIHTLLLKQFDLPLDIEMMTGRIQMVEMTGEYQKELIRALPPEVFAHAELPASAAKDDYSHPLYAVEQPLSDRQGTKMHMARHKRLGYPCAVLEDLLQNEEMAEMEDRLSVAGRLEHPIFPKILDYSVDGNRVLVYQEYTGARFLDAFLTSESLTEEQILAWTVRAAEGVATMYRKNLVLRDFARGSMVVTDAGELKILRVYHPYYGFVKIREETKRYYFEKVLQEIAILLAQLCLRKEPPLPLRILTENRFSGKFLLKVNLIIQKCVKENGSAQYRSFDELLADLHSLKITGKEKAFLKNRSKRLQEYDKARQQRKDSFVSTDRPAEPMVTFQTLEEQFGFDGTVTMQEPQENADPQIRVRICSNGQVMNFAKNEILIGKDPRSDMIWTQPYISRMHLRLLRKEDGTYVAADLNSTNGTYVLDTAQGAEEWNRIPAGSTVVVRAGARFRVGSSEIEIL